MSLYKISIHTFLAEGDIRQWVDMRHGIISIHTFLAEGDVRPSIASDSKVISIHTFLAEGDVCQHERYILP